MENVTEVIYSAIDALIFVAAITIIVFMYSNGVLAIGNAQSAVSVNETTSQTLVNASYEGYVKDGNATYDGAVTGKQVFTDILNMSDNNIIIVNGSTSVNMATKYITYNMDGLSGTKLLIDYVRNDNSTKLLDYIDKNATYIRQYDTDQNGNVTSVTYKKK